VIENPYFKPTSNPFQFNVCQATTYASVKTKYLKLGLIKKIQMIFMNLIKRIMIH
jgi:hypothetical protein